MGNSYSIDKSYGEIFINLETFKYLPGSQVNGYIWLNLLKPFPSDVIEIFVVGQEKVKFTTVTHYNTGKTSHRHVHVHRDGNEFFAYTYQLRSTIVGQFPGGQYSYPFSFILPFNLKPSFIHFWKEEGHNCYAKIQVHACSPIT